MIDLAAFRAADAAETAAYASMFDAAPAALKAAWGLRTERVGDATLLLAPGVPTPMFNRVIGLGTFVPTTEALLDDVASRYRAEGVANFWVSVSEAAEPPALRGWLDSRGFAPPRRRSWVQVRWTVPTAPVFDSSLEIVEASSANAAALAETIRASFGMPPPMSEWITALVCRAEWQGYAATRNGEVVGGGFVHVRRPLGWLGMGAILPAYRGGGGQLALMAARIARALAAGCTSVHTETGEPIGDEPNPSFLNMQRCGFERIGSRLNYASLP